MPRTSRIVFENGFFHVYNRALYKQDLFADEADYKKFLSKLHELKTKNKYDHSVYAYVLMPTHFHLLIQTQKIPIAKIMSSLLTGYSMYFNHKYKRFGPLFQNRFKSKLCEKEIYFFGASRYLYLNPVEAGLVSSPENYPWSSYRELLGLSEYRIIERNETADLIGKTSEEREKYRQFILEGIPITGELGKQYTFNKQVEGNPKFNKVIEKQLLRTKIRSRIEKLFNIK